jgi:CRISPR-associated protein Cas2
MFVLVFYDVKEKRVAKALKICRKYLTWVQNSVFEGELSPAIIEKMKTELRKHLSENEDSVIIYTWRSERYTERTVIGVEKGTVSQFI